MNLSVSLIKAFIDVTNYEGCGLQFRDIYLDKKYEKPTGDAVKLGQWFEYLCTGATLRDGTIPQPLTKGKGELNADSKRMQIQSEKWKQFVQYYQLTDIQTGVVLEYEYEGKKIKCILDVLCNCGRDIVTGEIQEPKKIIIDIKSTGMLDNQWEKYGWGNCINDTFKQTRNAQSQLEMLLMQSVIYPWMYEKIHGENIDFYYYVAGTTNSDKRKIIKSIPSEESKEKMIKRFSFVTEMIEYYQNTGWTTTDDYEICLSCPSPDCNKRLKIPKCIVVNI